MYVCAYSCACVCVHQSSHAHSQEGSRHVQWVGEGLVQCVGYQRHKLSNVRHRCWKCDVGLIDRGLLRMIQLSFFNNNNKKVK